MPVATIAPFNKQEVLEFDDVMHCYFMTLHFIVALLKKQKFTVIQ